MLDNWSFIGPGSEKKWYSSENSPQGAWDNIAEQMLLEFAESGHPTFRATTPLSRGILKSKGRGKLSIHFAADGDTIDTIYRIILSVNQLSLYGAVAAVCEEFESHQDGSGEPEILMGQSIVLGEVKAEDLLQNENPMNDQIIWQQYIQQVESLSPENRVSKFCKEAGFMRVVEVGQYFVTKDTCSLRQFRSVACREYILPRDDPTSQAKGWIQGNIRIGPVLEVTTSFQHFKYGIEIRIWSVNQDNSQSWVRISYGTIKYVVDSIQDNTEIPADPQEERVPQTSVKVLQPGQRQKQNHNRENLLGRQQPYPYTKEDGLTLSHQNKILPRTISRRKWSIFFDTIKRYRGKKMEQLNSTKSNSIFEIIIHKYKFGLMIDGKLVWLQEKDPNEDISVALIIWEQFSTSVLFRDTLDIISLILRYRTM